MLNGATKTYKHLRAVRDYRGDEETLIRLAEGTLKAFVFRYDYDGDNQLGFNLHPVGSEIWQSDEAKEILTRGYILGLEAPCLGYDDGAIFVEVIEGVKGKGGPKATDTWGKAIALAVLHILKAGGLPKNTTALREKIISGLEREDLGERQVERAIQSLCEWRAEIDGAINRLMKHGQHVG